MKTKLDNIIENLSGTNVLTLGGTPDFTDKGGMVGLTVVKGNLKIKVNLDAVEEAKLSISAMFLQHAEIMKSEKSEEKKPDGKQ